MKNMVLSTLFLFPAILFSQAPNQNISNYVFPDTEPFIAVNPTNPDNVIAAWMKLTAASQLSIAVSYSNNGGVSWSSPQNIPHQVSTWTSADVSIDFNSTGTAFLSFVDYKFNTLDSGAVLVTSSANGGATWTSPVEAVDCLVTSDKPVDRPWIVADKTGGTYDGNLYITTKNYEDGSTTNHVYFTKSVDDGLTWELLTIIDDSIPCDLVTSMGALTVGADGTIYIAYISYHTVMSLFPRIILSKSIDGGTTFTESIVTNVTGASVINDTLQGSVNLSANPTDPNNLIFTFTDGRNGDADILCIKSANGGTSWNNATPVRINDDATGNGNEQDMCWAAFAPDGTYAATWRDRRNGGTSVVSPFEIWVATSDDGGATFATNKKISTALSNDIPIVKGNDFIGIALSNDFLFTNWCDYRTGNYEIFTNRDSLQSLVSINEIKEEKLNVVCYPNPFTEEITFSFTLNEISNNIKISVYEINGKLVKKLFSGKLQKGKQEFVFNGKNLDAGNYLFSVEGEGVNVRKVFVKK